MWSGALDLQLRSSSTISCNITIIAHDHYTDIYSQTPNIKHQTYLYLTQEGSNRYDGANTGASTGTGTDFPINFGEGGTYSVNAVSNSNSNSNSSHNISQASIAAAALEEREEAAARAYANRNAWHVLVPDEYR